MSNSPQNIDQENCTGGLSEQTPPSYDTQLDLQELSPKHRTEYFEIKPILTSLGIELMKNDVSDKPDFCFCYEGKIIGLETTRCYPLDAKKHQNKYEIGDKGVKSILEKYKKIKTECCEWVSLHISFRNGLYYTLRDISIKRQDVERIMNEVIEEIETRLKRGHYSTQTTSGKCKTELYHINYKYTRTILVDEPQEGKVILGHGGEAIPERTIEIESLEKAISDKENKLTEYKQMEQNRNIDEYWLCVNLPVSSQRFFYGLEPFEIQSGYSRIYVTQFVDALRIK